jgi:hypothetical protein
MMRRIARSRIAGLIACLLILMLSGGPLLAAQQQGRQDFAKKVKEAENKRGLGDFDGSIKLLEELLRSPNFPKDLNKSAYELLAQNYLAKSYLEQAKSAIRKLLDLVPMYTPPQDDPPFAAEVEKVRHEMGTEGTIEPVEKSEESAWYESPWVWVGGGLLVAGGVLLLAGGSSDDGTTPPVPVLPTPPALP